MFRYLKARVRPYRELHRLREWMLAGLPAPPPHFVKQAVIRAYAKRYGTTVLVETGTYMGDMIAAMEGDFASIYSIELSHELYQNARRRFAASPHVKLIHGDSAKALRSILPLLSGPALFWLDGHWSGGVTAHGEKETPIAEELDQLLDATDLGHVILIDDARCFGVEKTYPTIDDLRRRCLVRRPSTTLSVDVDIIRIVPRGCTK
jgi:hypothetical protein